MKKFGYTLIELMVVIGVMAMVGALSIFALSSSNTSQQVTTAANELVGNLRSMQNRAINGAQGSNCYKLSYTGAASTTYTFASTTTSSTVPITKGVTITAFNSGGIQQNLAAISFLHPSALYTDCSGSAANTCNGVACNGSTAISGPLRFVLTKGSITKTVYVEYSGTQVNRIYVQ